MIKRSRLHLQVLAGRRVREALDQPRPRLLDPRPYPAEEGLLKEGRRQHAVRHRLLELVKQRLALLSIELSGLALEQVLQVRERAIGVEAVLGDEGLQPGGGVAGG